MPVKIKKEKKIKQKQKQSQKQIVNIKIGDVKKPVRRRRVVKKVEKVEKPSIQYMYQASGSQPAKQNIGSPEPLARPNLLGGPILQPEEIRQPETEPLQMGRGAEARPSILGGAFIPREEVAEQRVLRLRKPEEPSLYSDFPNPETINIEGENPFRAGIEEEVDIEPLQLEREFFGGGYALEEPQRFPTLGQERTSPAREVRRALQISQGAGSNVPLELLIQGKYNLEGEPRRTTPTVNQRIRLIEAGVEVKERTPKKKKEKKDT